MKRLISNTHIHISYSLIFINDSPPSGVLLTTQFAHRKSLHTCDALLRLSHIRHWPLKSGLQEIRTKEDIGIEQQLYEIVSCKNFALNCLS